MKHALPIYILIVVLLTVYLFSGTTGKIAGRAIDVTTGEPMMGVNIVIEGTDFGAATDNEGYYSILNIPPGDYTVKASMIGYKTIIKKEVKVMVDLTTNVNFDMEQSTIEGEEVVVTAEIPVVKKDVTSTSFRVGADEVEDLQTVELNEVISLQAGVIDGHFRGGRDGEVKYIVDGVQMNSSYSGDIPFQVESELVEEVEVISGTFNAEYGQAMSGVVNIVTKEGKNFYTGKANVFGGDYYTNNEDLYLNAGNLNPININNTQFSLQGPIPFIDRLTFSIIGRLYQDNGWLYGKELFLPRDSCNFSETGNYIESSGDSSYIPMNYDNKRALQGKITYKIFQNDKLNISFFYQDDDFAYYDHLFKYNPEGNYEHKRNSYQNSLQYNHQFSTKTFITFNLSHAYTNYEQYVKEEESEEAYAPIENLIGTGATGFSTGGMRMWHHYRKNYTYIAKTDLTSQITKIHKVKTGIQYKRNKLWLHEYQLYFDDQNNLKIPSPNSWYNNDYTHYPVQISAYFQDKIEIEDMIVNAGVRYDYFYPDGKMPAQFYDTKNAEKLDADATWKISPRLGIAYPITDQGVIHFSYGHFFQVPNYEYLYINPEFEVSLVQLQGDQPPRGRYNIMGNAELKPEKTISYELGLKQAISNLMSIDLTVYNKDIRDLIGMETRNNIYGGKFWRYINRDYANVKGITIALDKRARPGEIGFSIDYTYQKATGNASNPEDEWINNQQDPPIQTVRRRRPLNWDRRHSINISTTTQQRGYLITLIGKYGSGKPYTRSSARYNNRIVNGERMPYKFTIDLKVTKHFDLGSYTISPYLKIYNLTDRQNPHTVFSSSGRADYNYDMNFMNYTGIKTIEEFFTRPDYYEEPRKILLGCSISFGKK